MTLTGGDLNADQTEIIKGLHSFVDSAVRPIQDDLGDVFTDPRKYYLQDGRGSPLVTDARRRARELSAQAGYYTMFCPKEFGGADLGLKSWFLCWESLFHRYGAPVNQLAYFILSHFTSGPHEVWQHASDSLKAEVIPGLAAGKLQGCFALSEPDAGSDSFAMSTTAVRSGDDWVINGTKQWISWSPSADFVMVYAVTDRDMMQTRRGGGITCFYVPAGTPGFQVDSVIKLFGRIGGEEGILSFQDVRVPDRYRVGEVNRGFNLAMLGTRHGRLANAGRTLGLARWALDKAVAYAKTRKTFDVALADHQTIRNYLAESAIDLYSGRTMALDCAGRIDNGADGRSEVSMVKVYTTQVAFKVIDRAMQIHGGMGLANETELSDAWMNTRMTRITEGANEIQMRSIAAYLLSGRIDLGFV
jgi:butyryl-CoA dehydrogenase